MRNSTPRLREERTVGTAFAPALAAVLDVSRLDRRWTPAQAGIRAVHTLQETDDVAGHGGPRFETVRAYQPAGGATGSGSDGTAGEILRRIRRSHQPIARDAGVLLVTTSTTRAELDVDVEAVVAWLALTVEAGIRRAAAGGARVVVGVRPGPGEGLMIVVRDTGSGDVDMDPRVQQLALALNGRSEVQGNRTGRRVALTIPAAGSPSAV